MRNPGKYHSESATVQNPLNSLHLTQQLRQIPNHKLQHRCRISFQISSCSAHPWGAPLQPLWAACGSLDGPGIFPWLRAVALAVSSLQRAVSLICTGLALWFPPCLHSDAILLREDFYLKFHSTEAGVSTTWVKLLSVTVTPHPCSCAWESKGRWPGCCWVPACHLRDDNSILGSWLQPSLA